MATDLLLVRHAQTNSNIAGIFAGWSAEDLDNIGYTQANRLSSRLSRLDIASIYTSPLQRAYTTACIVAKPLNLEPKVLGDLIEINLGDWEGLHMDEVRRRWPDFWQRININPSDTAVPNGESLAQVYERAVRALQVVVDENRDKQAIIVTHGAVVGVLVAHVLGVPAGINQRLRTNTASLTVIRIDNGNSYLGKLNDTSHLEHDFPSPSTIPS